MMAALVAAKSEEVPTSRGKLKRISHPKLADEKKHVDPVVGKKHLKLSGEKKGSKSGIDKIEKKGDKSAVETVGKNGGKSAIEKVEKKGSESVGEKVDKEGG